MLYFLVVNVLEHVKLGGTRCNPSSIYKIKEIKEEKKKNEKEVEPRIYIKQRVRHLNSVNQFS